MLPCPISTITLLWFDQFAICGDCPLAMKVSALQLLRWGFVSRTYEVKVDLLGLFYVALSYLYVGPDGLTDLLFLGLSICCDLCCLRGQDRFS